MKRKNGFTIVESLIAVAMIGMAGTAVLTYSITETENKKVISLSNDMNSLLKGFDKRIEIDGYDYNLWSKTNWNNNEIENLTKKQLQAINSNCKNGEWSPAIGDNDLRLVNCNLFEKRSIPIEINVKIEKDTNSIIKEVIIDYSIENIKDYKDYFKQVRKAFALSKLKGIEFKSGISSFQYIDKESNTNISLSQCMKKNINCIYRTTLNRQGGGDYLRIDGSNTMIGSNINFRKENADLPIKCLKWNKSSNGAWVNENVNCGIGIYDISSQSIKVETALKNGTFENIFLNKSCKEFSKSGNELIEIGVSPCGLKENSNEIYQVTTNMSAENTYTKNIYTNELFVKNKIYTNELFVKNKIETKELIVEDKIKTKELIVEDKIKTKELIVEDKIKTDSLFSDKKIESHLIMKSPIGDFENIKNEFIYLNNKINNIESIFNNKIKNLTDRIVILETDKLNGYPGSESIKKPIWMETTGSTCTSRIKGIDNNIIIGSECSNKGQKKLIGAFNTQVSCCRVSSCSGNNVDITMYGKIYNLRYAICR